MSVFSFILLTVLAVQCCVSDYLYPGIQPTQTTPSLPEIIINKNISPGSSGYFYPVPQPPNEILPPLQDDILITPIDNGYLPPPSNEYLPPPQNDFPPFQPVPHPVYGVPGVPTTKQQNGVDLPTSEPYVRVLSMSCLDSSSSRFFKASIQSSDFANSAPVFPKSIIGCNVLKKAHDTFVINLEGIGVGNCGVRYCANKKMCLNLRLPTVAGLQLPEDRLVTLQCLPQHLIASVVRSLGIKTQKIQSRTIGFNTIASGGTQRPFRPHLALYRKGSQLVEPGSTVVLGEELLLKATINDGEDWKFAKIGSVVMQQGLIQTAGVDRKSVALVDSDGCRVESMKSVCPNHPEQLSNRVSVVPFRAFLFQDVDGDEMLLSVRLYGCMHQKDCQQTKHCEEKAALNTLDGGRNLNLGRRRRSMVNGLNSTHAHRSHYYASTRSMSNGTTKMVPIENNDGYDTIDNRVQDYESHLDFRVVLPEQYANGGNPIVSLKSRYSNERINNGNYLGWSMDDIYNGFLFISVVLIVGVTCIVILCVVAKFKKNYKPSFYSRKY